MTSGLNGVDLLDDDYVMHNLLDMVAIEEMILNCTSCKTIEKAVARCADCAEFLCQNCVSAHQYMRCFANHHVVQFKEILQSFKKLNEPILNSQQTDRRASDCSSSSSSSSTCSNSSSETNGSADSYRITVDCAVPIHKPLFCKSHKGENLKFFCNTCQTPICTECVVSSHQQPAHCYERLSEAEIKNIEELGSLIGKTKNKIEECQGDFQLLEQYSADLEDQKKQSKEAIEETYRLYANILEKRKNELINELDEKHSSKQQAITDLHDNVQGSVDQLYEAIQFVERILKNGNSTEILMLKHLIVNQVCYLTDNLPLTDNVDANLKFLTDQKRFEKAIGDTFGRFQTQKELKQSYLNNLTASTSQNESLMLASKSMNMTVNALNADNQRLNQIQNIQKQIEIQQQSSFSKSVGSFQTNVDQDWLMMSMLNNNQFKAQPFNGPNDLQPSDDWLSTMAKQQQLEAKNVFQQRPSLSPQSSASQLSNPWQTNGIVVPTPQQSQPKCNNFMSQPPPPIFSGNQMRNPNNFLNPNNIQKHSMRSNSPLPDNNNLMLTNSSNSLQQHQMFLQQQHLNTSRSQTPSVQQQQFTNFLNPAKLQNSDILSMNGSTGSISTSNQLVVNGLDEYLPFGANTTSMAQNFNHLSKMLTNQSAATSVLPDLSSLNVNLNELALTVNHNVFPSAISEINSHSSQSPPQALGPIGSNLNNQFSGNGNLNPPVRQNGKMSNMSIRNKFGQLGAGKAQFNSPHGFCLGMEEEIIVADTNNHRIVIFDKNGDFKYAFGSPGREEGQLWYPRKVTVMRDSGKFVVCDRGSERSRMQIFNKSGHFVKKISIRYIDIVAGLAITQDGEIVAVDSVSPTVFRIKESGDLNKWFDCSDFMREPSDIAISGNEYFVCDFKGHCVCVFSDEGTFMRRIGGENITNFPNGIDVSDAGDVLVGDSHGNRFHIAVFARDGEMVSEFECPYVKVSRCCGLKITSEGFVVTLAKNNHHVLVLNTLYVQ